MYLMGYQLVELYVSALSTMSYAQCLFVYDDLDKVATKNLYSGQIRWRCQLLMESNDDSIH